jgi:hypothetical protein
MKMNRRQSIRRAPSPGVYRALEIDRLVADHFMQSDIGRSIRLDDVPTARVALASVRAAEVAVLSWRWDVDPQSNASRNVYVACQEAKRQGVRYLLLDRVTVDQDVSDQDMLEERLAFSLLYQELPVLAAYDRASDGYAPTAKVHGEQVALGSELSRIMRRPWIAHEIKLYRCNPTRVTYVGHLPSLASVEDDGFPRMAKVIWESSMCQTVLYVLGGTVGMHHIEDFRFLVPQHSDLLAIAHVRMSRNDYLLCTALLVGRDERRVLDPEDPIWGPDLRVNNDQTVLGVSFDQFRIGEAYSPDDLPHTQDYYTRYDIFLGDHVVGRWQTRHKFYPFPDLKVWFAIEDSAEEIIRAFLRMGEALANEQGTQIPMTPEDCPEPGLALVFHDEDAL